MKHSLLAPLLFLTLASAVSHGAVVYSGLQNITVANGFDSVFLDVDGMSGQSSESPGWDVETFFSGEAFGNSAAFQPARQTATASSPIIRLAAGTSVGNTLNYFNQATGSSTHMGNGPTQFVSGTEGYLGFQLTDNSGNGPYYGWMRVNFSNTGNGGTIIDWAYDDSGSPINVGVAPEPSACALAGVAFITGAFRRRRR